jgi:hypothetical protein
MTRRQVIPCRECCVEVAKIAHRLHLLAEHLDIDLDVLELLYAADLACGTPASWAGMLAAGYDPLDGHPLEVTE